MIQKHDTDRTGYGIRARSSVHTLEQARELDSRPTRNKKKPFVVAEDGILTWIMCWGLFSLPGMMWFVRDGWGSGYGFVAGLFMCWAGWYWGQMCPFRNFILKRGPGAVGAMLLVNSILTLIIPPVLLLIVSLIVAPFGLGRFYAEKED